MYDRKAFHVWAVQMSSYLCTGRCRLSLSLHISDQGGMDATVCERIERKGLSEKNKCQHVESIRWAETVHHCLQAKLWHSLCYWSEQHHRIDLMLGFCKTHLTWERSGNRKGVAHEQRTLKWETWKGKNGRVKSANKRKKTWENRPWAKQEQSSRTKTVWKGRTNNDLKTDRGMKRQRKKEREREATILLNRFHNYHVTSGYQGYNHRRQVIFQPSGWEYKYKHPPQAHANASTCVCTTNTHTFTVLLAIRILSLIQHWL